MQDHGMGGGQVVKEGEETYLVLLLDMHPTALLGKEMDRDGKGVGCWHGYRDNTRPLQKL